MIRYKRAAAGITWVALAGCHAMPRTADEARACVSQAIGHNDGAALYRCLDQRTRWAIDSSYRDQAVTRSLIAARYPEDTAAAALAPLTAAAAADAPHYFAGVLGPGELGALGQRLVTGSLHFVRYSDKGWGLADLGDEWTQHQEHADHELKTVRENIKLLDKADPK